MANGNEWDDVSEIQAEAKTQLSDDTGHGKTAVIRMFEFKANPEVFKAHKPTKAELLLGHQTFIENMVWADGFTLRREVPPRISISKNKKKYDA